MKVTSPIEMCATRSFGVLFTAADQAIAPFPVPEPPDEMVSQVASLTAVRLQLELVAVIAMVPALADAVIVWDDGTRVKPHAADCVTLNAAVPIWINPLLEEALGLAS